MASTQPTFHRGPMLPPELERVVFEIAASNLGDIPNMMLVAWRVREWVEPYLFLVVSNTTLESEMFTTPFNVYTIPISQKPVVFWSKSVKSVFLDTDDTTEAIITRLLTACKGITRLFSHLSLDKHRDQLAALHDLRRLHFDLALLFLDDVMDLAHPLFRNITHLELLTLPSPTTTPAVFAGLALVPKLAHLAFNEAAHSNEMLPFLASLTHLHSLVLLHPESLREEEAGHVSPALAADDRFVLIGQTDYSADWFRGANGGEDFWHVADAFIKARRAGLVDRTRFSIRDTDRTWISLVFPSIHSIRIGFLDKNAFLTHRRK
ncbi:hypothetical protein C8R46DRAFT_1065462 [Mycena filopes]|nr:hypothetical protein C8R46DRAFT_1065462 [Mycena filopes]